jgi:hypothetical protein
MSYKLGIKELGIRNYPTRGLRHCEGEARSNYELGENKNSCNSLKIRLIRSQKIRSQKIETIKNSLPMVI